MDVAQQRDIDIDRPRPSAQRWPRWQNLRGVFDNESLTQLLGAYRMESLLDSNVSDNNSESGSVVLALSAKVARKTNTKWQLTLTVSIMDRNANAAENVLVDLYQELEHVRRFICGCRCFMLDPAVNNSWIGKNVWQPERRQRRWQPDWG